MGSPPPGLESPEESESEELLSRRGFFKVELLAVIGGGEDAEIEEEDDVLLYLTGIYYKTPRVIENRSCYQRIIGTCDSYPGLRCGHEHLYWSPVRHGWRFGELDDENASLAYRLSGDAKLSELGGNWMVLVL